MDRHMEDIADVIAQHVKDVIEDKMFDVQSCLNDMLGRLLWSLKLEYEREYKKVFPMKEIISHLMRSVYRAGPEGETWPEWDYEGMKTELDNISAILNKHGITQLSR